MSYLDAESPFTLRRIAAGLGGIAVAILAGAFIRSGGGDGTDRLLKTILQREVTVEQVEAELQRDATVRGMMTAFRTHYRPQYDEFMVRIVRAANEEGNAAVRREAFLFMQNFVRSKAEHIASAPAPDLNALGQAMVTLSEALRQSDVPTCARFHITGLGPRDAVPARAMPASMRVSVHQFRAARHAEDGNRVARGPLSETDAAAWFARLETIDPRSAQLVANDRLAAATPAQQCDAGLAIYQAAADLPAEQSANVTAEFIRESMRTIG